jgi:hypothetical protein
MLIIFYLNKSESLEDIQGPFVNGIMESAKLIPIPHSMQFFGIRFQPGVLSYLLNTDMKLLKNKMQPLILIDEIILNNLTLSDNRIDSEILHEIIP